MGINSQIIQHARNDAVTYQSVLASSQLVNQASPIWLLSVLEWMNVVLMAPTWHAVMVFGTWETAWHVVMTWETAWHVVLMALVLFVIQDVDWRVAVVALFFFVNQEVVLGYLEHVEAVVSVSNGMLLGEAHGPSG